MIAKLLNVLFPVAIAGSFIAVVVKEAKSSKRGSGSHVFVERSKSKHVAHTEEVGGDLKVERGFPGQSGNLVDISLKTGGEIQVKGWENDSIDVIATLDGDDCAEARVGFNRREGGLVITLENPRRRGNWDCDADFELQVPKRQSLKMNTMGGDIQVENIEGEVRGQTMGGSLELTRLTGYVGLTTMGGDITLTQSEVDGSVKTMGGAVLLEDVIGAVKGESMGGNVTTRRVAAKKGQKTSEAVSIKTMGGDINVDEAPAGANVHTMGGKIRIKSAAQHVKAVTMGGAIEIDELDGSIEATTMGGDIEVGMIGDAAKGNRAVNLKSHGGDVMLMVPAGLSMDLDLEIAYTKESQQDYKIISDFPFTLKETSTWAREGRGGDLSKYIYGTGAVAGGKHKIRIETVNGNIILKKSRR